MPAPPAEPKIPVAAPAPEVKIPNNFGIARVYRMKDPIPLAVDAYVGNRDLWSEPHLADEYASYLADHPESEWVPGIFMREGSAAWERARKSPGLAILSPRGEFTPSKVT